MHLLPLPVLRERVGVRACPKPKVARSFRPGPSPYPSPQSTGERGPERAAGTRGGRGRVAASATGVRRGGRILCRRGGSVGGAVPLAAARGDFLRLLRLVLLRHLRADALPPGGQLRLELLRLLGVFR